ncbi:N-acetylmuramic acid 6-phosphate etherase [Schleiferia thermophila]|jgi:N-acetylmuramic acid 6-phosphate etherase|uniref:N-acetylmuramic acid 6-phosphate etherase n=1 Tax=Schleiferia thermophila TaxID=884107 RepID=A0A369A7M9_9FLAO|nr:N-acetylmuramic acid 6-phosphate etherase [Schleiferia thermophila]KFD39944.1 N-acetylmuramic acid-6-phosphate etherase [Schleiferia thermophila str. Yellowstone]RCX05362.1 N-acetylmuramic acid 6-phosphate etherase [Schleiferia thermophila]GCD79131.1 N-acetylmuramic acid 6-phosphate etherase [Schleiferia thermophila]
MNEFQRITEQDSPYRHLEQKTLRELLEIINREDQTVPIAVQQAIPQIEALASAVYQKLAEGGRLFYIGAGTSGRLGIVDASECPPTFGVPHGMVIGLIAGGDGAIRRAVEFAEDDEKGAWHDLLEYGISEADIVVGIAASGTTPYVVGGLEQCRKNGILTGCITCNPGSPVTRQADFPVVVVTGPEVVTGSTRMKAGTAQKLVLNMLTTSVMIRLGRVEDNKMVRMQLANNKLIDRATRIVSEKLNISYEKARMLVLNSGDVKSAISLYKNQGQ